MYCFFTTFNRTRNSHFEKIYYFWNYGKIYYDPYKIYYIFFLINNFVNCLNILGNMKYVEL